MRAETVDALRARTTSIKHRWAALLQVELVITPLANPESFAYLMPDTLEEILARLLAHRSNGVAVRAAECPGRCNPYKGYFIAAERSLVEALRSIQPPGPGSDDSVSELAELRAVIQTLAAAEVDTFCGVCTFRGTRNICRFAPAAVMEHGDA